MRTDLFILIFSFLLGVWFALILTSAHPKVITQTVTKEVQLPAPKTYICNAGKGNPADLSNCFEVATDSANTYCFDNHCSYIYTDKELK